MTVVVARVDGAGITMNDGPVPDVGDDGVHHYADPNWLMGSREAAAFVGVRWSTWRSYVSRGFAPLPDAGSRWRVATVSAWNRARPKNRR